VSQEESSTLCTEKCRVLVETNEPELTNVCDSDSERRLGLRALGLWTVLSDS